jgi:hypothetical protein
MERMTDKAKQDLEKAKAKGDKFTMVQYAKQVLQGQKMKEKYLINKAKVNSMKYSIDSHFGNKSLAALSFANDVAPCVCSCNENGEGGLDIGRYHETDQWNDER